MSDHRCKHLCALSDATDVPKLQGSYHLNAMMRINPRNLTYSTLLLLSALALILIASVSLARAQTTGAASNRPVFSDYRGVQIGMSAEEVRKKLDRLKNGGPAQDFFVFSERESAQIYYDKDRKVTAISVDYFGDSNAPAPSAVLGVDLQAKPDGSMYELKRYPEAGYWVSYSRTAGDKPIVTITMQKI